jgi:hypothetical protein
MKNTGTIILSVILLIIAFVAVDYFYLKKVFFKPTEDGEKNVKKENGEKSNSNTSPDKKSSFPLIKGSKGKEVKYLQAALNHYKNQNLTIDGIFGADTENTLNKIFKVKAVIEKDYNIWVKPYISTLEKVYSRQGIIL